MGTIRLGKRSEGRSPKIKEMVPLASLDDLVFGGWDIFEEDCYAAARTAGVLEPSLLAEVRQELEAIRPLPAAFAPKELRRLRRPKGKTGEKKQGSAQQRDPSLSR